MQRFLFIYLILVFHFPLIGMAQNGANPFDLDSLTVEQNEPVEVQDDSGNPFDLDLEADVEIEIPVPLELDSPDSTLQALDTSLQLVDTTAFLPNNPFDLSVESVEEIKPKKAESLEKPEKKKSKKRVIKPFVKESKSLSQLGLGLFFCL